MASIIYSLGLALEFIHSNNVIHRDIKPDNIVFNYHGSPSLTDFGVAYVSDTSEKPLITCQTNGTKAYLPPEIYARTHAHGIECDYWCLGMVAHEMVHGIRPVDHQQIKKYAALIETDFQHEVKPIDVIIRENRDDKNISSKNPNIDSEGTTISDRTSPIQSTNNSNDETVHVIIKDRQVSKDSKVSTLSKEAVNILEMLLTIRPQHRISKSSFRNHKVFQVHNITQDKVFLKQPSSFIPGEVFMRNNVFDQKYRREFDCTTETSNDDSYDMNHLDSDQNILLTYEENALFKDYYFSKK